jgi:hypothetical protein
MDAHESWDTKAPETGIDFDRLCAIRAELVRLTHFWQVVISNANDLSLGFIPAITFNVLIMADVLAGSGTPGTTQIQIYPLVTWILQKWARLFPPHSVSTMIIYTLLAFGFPLVLLLIRNGYVLIRGRRLHALLRFKLEQSQLLSRFIDGWDELPDINTYVHRVFRSFILWPVTFREKPSPVQRQVRILVNNLDWYTRPPKQLLRWQWINTAVRAVAGVFCIVAQFGVLSAGSGFNQPISQAESICLLAMLGSCAVFLLTCVISAVVPVIPVSTRARILLNKLKPVFEILGPEPAGR